MSSNPKFKKKMQVHAAANFLRIVNAANKIYNPNLITDGKLNNVTH